MQASRSDCRIDLSPRFLDQTNTHALVAQVAVQLRLADVEVARDLAYAQFALALHRFGGDGSPFGLALESLGASP